MPDPAEYVFISHPNIPGSLAQVPATSLPIWQARGWVQTAAPTNPATAPTDYLALLKEQVSLAQAAVAEAQAYTGAVPLVGPTQPTDPTRLWVDTNSVFSTDLRTSRSRINVTIAGSVTITLGATPTDQSEQVWRSRGGGTPVLLTPTTDYTLSGKILTVPSSQVGDVLTVRFLYFAVDGISAAQAVADVPLISDSFDRANSTTTLGSTETGQVWSVPLDFNGAQPVWGVTANTAYPVSNPNNRAFALVDTGLVDHTVQAKITFTASTGLYGLAFASDATGGASYTTNLSGLARWVSGAATTLATWTPMVSGDTIRVTRKGDQLTVFVQSGSAGAFNQVAQVSDATHHGTRAGMNARSTATSGRWDDFRVYAA